MAQDQQEPQDDDEGRDALAGAPVTQVTPDVAEGAPHLDDEAPSS